MEILLVLIIGYVVLTFFNWVSRVKTGQPTTLDELDKLVKDEIRRTNKSLENAHQNKGFDVRFLVKMTYTPR